MNSAQRLAEVVTALEKVGLTSLVMGGHAVRYYGLERNTNDYDLHLAPQDWDQLPQRLMQTGLAGKALVEGPSWRPKDFRRFQIGRLPDGREEWLEFWRSNHLLAPFAQLLVRCERGEYGGRTLPFLSLADLIHSKETERAVDWNDVLILEEFLDARHISRLHNGEMSLVEVLRELRSRRGFERLMQRGALRNVQPIEQALKQTRQSIAQAFLLPFLSKLNDCATPSVPIEPTIIKRLRTVAPASPLHLALVEAVRRQYKTAMQDRDRADKQSALKQ